MEYGLAFNYPWKTDYSNTTAEVTINGPGVNKTITLSYPDNVVFETFLPGQIYNWSVTVDGVSSNTWNFTVANKIHPSSDRSVDINADDEKLIPNHNKSLSLSDGVLSFLKFDIPSSALDLIQKENEGLLILISLKTSGITSLLPLMAPPLNYSLMA